MEEIKQTDNNVYTILVRKFRNLDNIRRFGINNGKLNRRVNKKSEHKDLYLSLNLNKNGNVLHVPGYDDESET